jgi:hypothetical protein
MTQDTLYRRLSACLFVLLTCLVLITFSDYGMSWDELAQDTYGELLLRFYTSFFTDRAAIYEFDLFYYGGFFELLSKVATRLLPFGIYESRHLMSALFGVLGVLGCWKLTGLVSNAGAAFWSAVLLTLYPSYYGHMFINSKDIPFAALYVWALYYGVRLLREFPNLSFKAAAQFGIASGLAMGVRVGGMILLCYLYLFLAGVLAVWLLHPRDPRGSSRRVAGRTLLMAAAATLVAYAVMLTFWPFGQTRPLVRPFEALAWFARNDQPSPMTYIPLHFAFKLPELSLALIAIGLYLGVRVLYVRGPFKDFQACALVVFSILFPLIYGILTTPRLYDEVRHFLFVVPPLCCLNGIVLDHVLRASMKKAVAAALVSIVLATYGVFHIAGMIELHPYEYSYYNRLIGGVYGAAQKGYLTEYWGTSYKEGVRALMDYLRARDGRDFNARSYRILLGSAPWCASYYFPGNFVPVTEASEADIFLTTTRYGEDSTHEGAPIVTVERSGVTFVIGKQIREVGNPSR